MDVEYMMEQREAVYLHFAPSIELFVPPSSFDKNIAEVSDHLKR